MEEDMDGEEIAEDGGIEEGIDDGGSEEEGGSDERGSWDELMTLVMMLVLILMVVSVTGGGSVVTGGGMEVTVGGPCTDDGDSDIQKVVVQQKECAQEKLGANVTRF